MSSRARAAVFGGGVLLVLGALSVLLGVWGDLGALLLVLFLAPTAVMMHGLWKESDPGAKMNEQIQFNKDILGSARAGLLQVGAVPARPRRPRAQPLGRLAAVDDVGRKTPRNHTETPSRSS